MVATSLAVAIEKQSAWYDPVHLARLLKTGIAAKRRFTLPVAETSHLNHAPPFALCLAQTSAICR